MALVVREHQVVQEGLIDQFLLEHLWNHHGHLCQKDLIRLCHPSFHLLREFRLLQFYHSDQVCRLLRVSPVSLGDLLDQAGLEVLALLEVPEVHLSQVPLVFRLRLLAL